VRDDLFDALLAETSGLAREFANSNRALYLVGGIVRDTLLGRVRADVDIDFTTDALPDEIESIVRRTGPTALWTQGKRFGTIGATIVGPNGPRAVEITTHRAEQYHDDSRKPEVRFSNDITLDLSRRDFTVNALAFDVHEHRLHDPFEGSRDLQLRILRTPLSPEISFRDDPLRMLRAARFLAGLHLVADPSLTDSVVAHRDRMAIISAERIRSEMEKLLTLPDPSAGLAFLFDTGLLFTFLPELAGVDPARTTARVIAMESTWERRFNALVFRAFRSEAEVRSRLRDLKCSVDEISLVLKILRLDLYDLEVVGASDRSTRRFVDAAGGECDLYLSLVAADADAGRSIADPTSNEVSGRLEQLRGRLRSLSETGELDDLGPALDGAQIMDLLGLPSGRQVGEALQMLRDLRLDEGRLSDSVVELHLMEWFDQRQPNRG
jgi:poly(A) polymerase